MSTPQKIKRYLSNVDVEFISLVDKAANRREFIYKAADGYNPQFDTPIVVKKVDDEKELVYGIVYAPDEADAHGDAMTVAELEKAAHNFLAKARTSNVDTQHDSNPDDGVVVESYILGKNDSRFPGEKENAWAVVIKVTDAATRKAVKDGVLKGISLAGKAQAEKVTDDPDNLEKSIELIMTKFADTLKKIFKSSEPEETIEKDFTARVTAKEMRQAIWALEEEFSAILNDSETEITDKKKSITEAVGQFSDYISKVSLGESTTTTTTSATMTQTDKKAENGGAADAEKDQAKTAPEETSKTMDEKLDAFMKATTDSVDALTKKVETLEKSAPGRQSTEDAGAEEVQKNNPKAPLGIFS